MKHSESIANIAAALVAAQADIKAVGKDSVNPHFKSKFASLDSIIDMVRPALSKHGLAIVQGATLPESHDGVLIGFTVETMLVHKSGEWITNGAVLPMVKADPQGAGAAMTYGRRYSLAALLSISTDEDDDGNHASTPTTRAAKSSASTNQGNPSEKLMPFGKTKGQKLGDLTADQLQSTITWCREKDAVKFADLINACAQVLEGRGTMSALADDDNDLPF